MDGSAKKGCDVEIANLHPQVDKLLERTKLDAVFKKFKDVFGSKGVP
jgi:anti-anti-sigma regulatory factor